MTKGAERVAAALSQGFLDLYPAEAARVVDNRPQSEIIELLQSKPAPIATAVFQRMAPDVAAQTLPLIESNLARQMVAAMDPSQAAGLLARADAEGRTHLLDSCEPSLAKELKLLLSYPADSAGSLMDPQVTTFHSESTVKEARARIRALRGRRVDDIFLVNENGLLTGGVPLQEIVLARPNSRLADLSAGVPASVHAMSTREEVVELLNQRRLSTLAVVDLEQRLLGVIRHDALVAAAQEEMSADIQTMVGVSKEERALSKATFAVRKRLPLAADQSRHRVFGCLRGGPFRRHHRALHGSGGAVAGGGRPVREYRSPGVGCYDARARAAGSQVAPLVTHCVQRSERCRNQWSRRRPDHRGGGLRLEPVGGSRSGDHAVDDNFDDRRRTVGRDYPYDLDGVGPGPGAVVVHYSHHRDGRGGFFQLPRNRHAAGAHAFRRIRNHARPHRDLSPAIS